MKAIGEFLWMSLLLIIILLLVLKEVSDNNWEKKHCRWDKNMHYQCDKKG